jgi:integrase
MAKRLTTKAIENAKPRADRYELSDGGGPLRFIVQPSGYKSAALRYRFNGKPKKLTLEPSWPALTLAAARKAAADAMHEVAQGRDPAALKFEAKATAEKASAERAADTVEQWAVHFIERHAKKKTRENSWRQAVHVFDDIVLPAWRGRIIHDIKRRDIIEAVENVAEDHPIMANRVHAHLSKFFNWLCERDVIAASPCAGVKRPSAESARERILSDDEIKALWLACGDIGDPAGACVRVLLLTGQRRSEVAGMRRSEINGDVWTLDASRTKNKRPHTVSLSTQALAIIETMPRIVGSDYVFTTSGWAPLGHFDRTKRELDAHMKPQTPWVVHDLRRTVASGMAKLGIRLPVIEKVLNHSGGSFRGIVGVYQRHDFAAEKRRALQAWADQVDAVVRGEPVEKVVRLDRGGGVT